MRPAGLARLPSLFFWERVLSQGDLIFDSVLLDGMLLKYPYNPRVNPNFCFALFVDFSSKTLLRGPNFLPNAPEIILDSALYLI